MRESLTPDTIDLTTVLHSAISVPAQIAALERTIVWSCVALGAIGVINAVLLIMVLCTRLRAPAIAVSASAVAPAEPAPQIAAGAVPARACGCGARISARSTSGRCRQCAHDHRVRSSSPVAGGPAAGRLALGPRNRWQERVMPPQLPAG